FAVFEAFAAFAVFEAFAAFSAFAAFAAFAVFAVFVVFVAFAGLAVFVFFAAAAAWRGTFFATRPAEPLAVAFAGDAAVPRSTPPATASRRRRTSRSSCTSLRWAPSSSLRVG